MINSQARTKHGIPAVHVERLHNGRYEGLETPHWGTNEVNLGPMGTLLAKNCIKPRNVDKIMNGEGHEQRLRREKAEKTREEGKNKRLEEEERRKRTEKNTGEEKKKNGRGREKEKG